MNRRGCGGCAYGHRVCANICNGHRVATSGHLIRTRKRKLASTVLDHFQEWTLESFEVPAGANAVARRFGLFLIRKSLLPPKEKSDGLILGQTSWAEISLLVTSDHHLLEIDPALLAQAFVEAGLFPVTPVHPRALMRAVR